MSEDFTVVTTQDIKELRDAIDDWQQNGWRKPEFNLDKAIVLISRTNKLLNNMIKSTERHS